MKKIFCLLIVMIAGCSVNTQSQEQVLEGDYSDIPATTGITENGL